MQHIVLIELLYMEKQVPGRVSPLGGEKVTSARLISFLLLYMYLVSFHIVRLGALYMGPHYRELGTLNVYTGQNPRQHVILLEIQPKEYNNDLY